MSLALSDAWNAHYRVAVVRLCNPEHGRGRSSFMMRRSLKVFGMFLLLMLL